MRLRQRRIEFDRPLRCTANLGRGFIAGNPFAIKEKDISICQAGIGLGVIWILGDRLVELIQGLVKALAGSLRQVEASLHIELVGLCILGSVPLLFASATYLQLQLSGNVGGNVVLDRSDIGSFALVLLAPDLRAVAYIHHLS